MKKALSILLSLCMLFSITAGLNLTTYAETEGYYTYSVSDGEATITACGAGISGDIEIPSTLGGYPVTIIVGYAFEDCTSLTSITIPNSVTNIGDAPFYNCTSLTGITVDSSNEYYSSQDWVLFNKDKTELIQYPAGNTRASYSIPNSVTSIGDEAFSGCTSLTSITIPDSVTSIDDYAFRYCTSLTSVTIPNSVTSIGHYAFGNCTSLTGITIPDSVTSIGHGAFSGCTSLTSVTIPNSVTSIGDGAFSGCTSLTSVTIPNSVTSIGDGAFAYCTSLTGITVDSSNEYYSSQDGVLFNKDKTELRRYPIGNTRTSYSIPNSVTSIGFGAFAYCSSLTSVTIPDSVTSIGDEVFAYCTSLTDITVDSSNEYYSSQDGILFNKDKTELIQYPVGNTRASYSIPNSVTRIGYEAFSGCTSLTSITIPDSVTSIDIIAFAYCESLTSITIPDSVTSIDIGAFYNCESLTDVYYKGSEEEWNQITFGEYNDCLLNANIHFNFSPAENINAKGGSIRLSDKGLRFGFSFKENENTIVEEYGFVYASGSVSELTIDTEGARTSVANNRITHDDGTTTFNLVFTNIPTSAYNMVISARAYVKIDGEYYYSDILQRSFMGVANAVLADDSVDDSIKQELTEIIKEA